MNVFVVEDDADVRELLQSLLSESHRVWAFASGQSALAALRTASPDVLLCDLGLPDMPGEEVVRAVAGLPTRPRIILMSGEHDRLQRARPLGHQVLPKPFSIRALTGILGA